MRLTRITLYTPAVVLHHVAAAYAALLGAEPVTSTDERGELVEITNAEGFTIELRPVDLGVGEALTATRLEFRGPDAAEAADRLRAETGDVQRHLYGGWWDSIAGVNVRLIGDGEDVPAEERARISAAIARGELEQELERVRGRR